MVAVVIAVVAPSASTVVVVAQAVFAVVVDTLSPPSGLDGVPCVAVGPKCRIKSHRRGVEYGTSFASSKEN
jgi:hypothetical protein